MERNGEGEGKKGSEFKFGGRGGREGSGGREGLSRSTQKQKGTRIYRIVHDTGKG